MYWYYFHQDQLFFRYFSDFLVYELFLAHIKSYKLVFFTVETSFVTMISHRKYFQSQLLQI